LVANGAHLGEARHLVVHVEEPCDAAGRRGIENDRVVDRALAALLAPAGCLVDLSGQQHVSQPGRDRRREVDGTELVQDPSGTTELVEHVEVVEQRGSRLDGEGEHLAAVGPDRDRPLGIGQRRDVEDLGDALAVLDLAQQHAPALAGERERERAGDGGLAGSALAGDDVQPDALEVAAVLLSGGRHGSGSPTAGGGGRHSLRVVSRGECCRR
jgi:hypothetical protein